MTRHARPEQPDGGGAARPESDDETGGGWFEAVPRREAATAAGDEKDATVADGRPTADRSPHGPARTPVRTAAEAVSGGSAPVPPEPVRPGAVPSGAVGAGSIPALPAPSDAVPAKPGRDRYLDLLRSIALVRVVVYHLFGWAWLTVLFPSMGVMFALAGSLMARSLNRPAAGVIRGRLRRLLPPVWLFGGIVLVLLFLQHWNPGKEEGVWGRLKVFCYLLPVGAPPYPEEIGSPAHLFDFTWADQAAGPLWYIRAYLWFVIASPVLLRAFRRFPWPTLLAPLALTAVIGTGLVDIPGETGLAITDFAVYGSCWILGFAHQEGALRRVPRYMAVSCSALVMAFGLWWARGHLSADGWNLNDIPLAQATWSFGFVVILLLYSPSWQRLPGRLAPLDKMITLSNNRAVTIYLWHNALIMATVPILDLAWRLPSVGDRLGAALDKTYGLWMFILVWPLLALVILALGWIEDVAAKRRPRLWPDGARPAARRLSDGPPRAGGSGGGRSAADAAERHGSGSGARHGASSPRAVRGRP